MRQRSKNKIDTRLRSKRQWGRSLILVVAGLLLLAGGYMLMLTLAPSAHLATTFDKWNRPVESPKVGENRLYIPSITLNIDYAAGGPEVLNDKSWWRYPERGNPEKGGNFILSAHRFEIGFTPDETIRKSPFYHFDRISEGDKVYVDFEGKRYEYIIEKKLSVKPTAVEIENPTEGHQLTIYTCDLGGQDVGREVAIARLSRKDIDPAMPL